MPLSNLLKKLRRRSTVPNQAAHAAPSGPVTLTLTKRSPQTAVSKAAATVEGAVATVSEQEAYAIGKAYVSRVRVKYHRKFDFFKNNTGKTNKFDQRTVQTTNAAAGTGGNEPLTDQQELLWTGEVSVGTPAQVFNLDFDTGSSDTWVNPGIYKPAASSTAKKTKKTFQVAYGDGSQASGDVYQESVSVGGVTATNQAFGNATKSTLSSSGNNQGLVGLAFESIAQFQAPPLFDTLFSQGAVASDVFSVGLWTEGARLDLGQIVAEAYTGSVVYSPVDSSQGFWSTSFEVTGATGTQTGIIDTGTTLLIGPPDVVTQIYQSLGVQTQTQDGEVYGVYPTNSPPSISLTFNGTAFTISPDALSFQVQGDQTIGGLIGADIGAGPAWIVGDTFLQDVYAVFDKGNLQVGFAPKASSSVPTSSGGATQTTDAAT